MSRYTERLTIFILLTLIRHGWPTSENGVISVSKDGYYRAELLVIT